MNTNPNPPPLTTTVCDQCGFNNQKILHNVPHRSTFRRLCTTCILRLHHQSFCPSCLTVYTTSPPQNAVVCHKCKSYSHPNCIIKSQPATLLRCVTCLNPNNLVFDTKSGTIDLRNARLLVAAAEISSVSIKNAEMDLGQEADRSGKVAADTRKRAREAIKHVVRRMEVEKRKRES
uniref:uncharacterized protein LOC122598632 n=1 Tax=Erigeron canadensis TaxID=72917 RepID=UPI001CB8C1E0|nr:uncharacterized protein LOC122598632 [Erigeron canadensis]